MRERYGNDLGLHRPVEDYRCPPRAGRAFAARPDERAATSCVRQLAREDAARLGVLPNSRREPKPLPTSRIRITPRRSDSRLVGAQFVRGCQGRRSRRRRRRGDGRAEASLVERTLLHHRTLHAATATRASRTGRARSGRCVSRLIATATAGGSRVATAAAGRGITAAAAATVEQSAATTAGGGQKSESNREERETFHRDNPFRGGRSFVPVRTAAIADLLTARTRSRDQLRVDFEKNFRFRRD
jgi:hypothetical protein